MLKKIWHNLVEDAKNLNKKVFESYKEDNTILFSASEVPSEISKQFTLLYNFKNLKCCNLPDCFSLKIWSFLYEDWLLVCDIQSPFSNQEKSGKVR